MAANLETAGEDWRGDVPQWGLLYNADGVASVNRGDAMQVERAGVDLMRQQLRAPRCQSLQRTGRMHTPKCTTRLARRCAYTSIGGVRATRAAGHHDWTGGVDARTRTTSSYVTAREHHRKRQGTISVPPYVRAIANMFPGLRASSVPSPSPFCHGPICC